MSLLAGLKVIYAQMSSVRRRQFFAVMALMLAGAIAELGTIGSVIPFIALLADQHGIHQHWMSLLPGSPSRQESLMIVGAAFITFAVLAGVVRFQLAMLSHKFIYQLGHELAVEIQRRLMLQPYSFHVNRNTSTLLTAFSKTEFAVGALLLPLMQGVTSGVIAIVVLALLVALDPVITTLVAGLLVLTYVLFSALFRKRLDASSAVQKTAYDDLMQVIQESLDGIREVIVDRSQAMYLAEFRQVDLKLAKARTTNQLIFLAPHYMIEIVGMVLIATVALVLGTRNAGIVVALPVLGTLALGAQRLLPLVQNVYRGWSGVAGNRSVFDEVVSLLSLPAGERSEPSVLPLELHHRIRLEGVSLAYPGRMTLALEDIDLVIPRGTMLALTGPTGSGKSTLADLIMGLLPPTTGSILIDDVPLDSTNVRPWWRAIAHVPQAIFLADASIERNIALSLPDAPADRTRVIEAAKKAQLHDFVMSLPDGYDTAVGERGVRLSGGQRQRLGIARAIYKDAPVLVLDEATSALDDRTEAGVIAVLQELRREGRTIILIAHRASTIRNCDVVARVEDGRLVELRGAPELAGRGKTRA